MPHCSYILNLQSWHHVTTATACLLVILGGWVKLLQRGVVEPAGSCEECGVWRFILALGNKPQDLAALLIIFLSQAWHSGCEMGEISIEVSKGPLGSFSHCPVWIDSDLSILILSNDYLATPAFFFHENAFNFLQGSGWESFRSLSSVLFDL